MGNGMVASIKTTISSKCGRLNLLLIVVGLGISLAAVIGGAHVQEGYAIGVGTVSPIRFRAPYHMVNPYQTQLNREAAQRAAENVVPVLERDTTIHYSVNEGLEDFFEAAELARQAYRSELEAYFEAVEALARAEILQAGSAPEGEAQPPSFPDPLTAGQLPIHLNDNQVRLLVEMNEDQLEIMMSGAFNTARQILDDGLIYLDIRGLLSIQEHLDTLIPSELAGLAFEIVSSYIEPNIFENVEETELVRGRVADDYETIYYQAGQMIVDADELITNEAFMALESLGLIRTEYSINIPLISGAALLVLAVYCMALAYIFIFCKDCFASSKESLLFFTLYTATVGIAWVIASSPGSIPYTFVPLMAFSMLLVIFFEMRLGLVANSAATLITAMIKSSSIEFVAFFILMGVVVAMVASFTTTRSRIMFAGASITVFSALSYLGVSVFFARSISQATIVATGYASMAGLFTVVLAVGSAPFWEAVFGLVTPFRLIDLANPNHPILRKLAIEAPGTYHHSLIVANLAEAAAYEIGANPHLARAGGYFHDIGKIKHPIFFAENQGKDNPHDSLEPAQSCKILVDHVEYGLELAEKNKLPSVISAIIEQHHGTTLMKYFYHRACSQAQDNSEEAHPEPDEADYRYCYRIPQSREAAIIMLADTVEAAVRSRFSNMDSFDEVEVLVETLVKAKIDDGQLLASGFTLKDIDMSIQAFLKVFRAMNHARVSYPGTGV